ncbi:low affinity immunoglobulin epsilon Fc receptor-like [Oculina patagonica]
MESKATWKSMCFLLIFLGLTCRDVTSQELRSSPCPYNWILKQGRCYKFFSTKLEWFAAKSACEALGSELVIINSQAEQQGIRAIIKQKIWIGLSRDPKDRNSFLWVDGSRPGYTNWGAGEPNNHNGGEDCTETGSTWNDLLCGETNPYVCETFGKSENIVLYIVTVLYLVNISAKVA